MRVDKKMPFEIYLRIAASKTGRIASTAVTGTALVSRTYFYFGKNALPLSKLPASLAVPELLKKGIGFRRDLPEATLATSW